MKKKLLSVLCASVMALGCMFGFAGCGGGKEESNTVSINIGQRVKKMTDCIDTIPTSETLLGSSPAASASSVVVSAADDGETLDDGDIIDGDEQSDVDVDDGEQGDIDPYEPPVYIPDVGENYSVMTEPNASYNYYPERRIACSSNWEVVDDFVEEVRLAKNKALKKCTTVNNWYKVPALFGYDGYRISYNIATNVLDLERCIMREREPGKNEYFKATLFYNAENKLVVDVDRYYNFVFDEGDGVGKIVYWHVSYVEDTEMISLQKFRYRDWPGHDGFPGHTSADIEDQLMYVDLSGEGIRCCKYDLVDFVDNNQSNFFVTVIEEDPETGYSTRNHLFIDLKEDRTDSSVEMFGPDNKMLYEIRDGSVWLSLFYLDGWDELWYNPEDFSSYSMGGGVIGPTDFDTGINYKTRLIADGKDINYNIAHAIIDYVQNNGFMGITYLPKLEFVIVGENTVAKKLEQLGLTRKYDQDPDESYANIEDMCVRATSGVFGLGSYKDLTADVYEDIMDEHSNNLTWEEVMERCDPDSVTGEVLSMEEVLACLTPTVTGELKFDGGVFDFSGITFEVKKSVVFDNNKKYTMVIALSGKDEVILGSVETTYTKNNMVFTGYETADVKTINHGTAAQALRAYLIDEDGDPVSTAVSLTASPALDYSYTRTVGDIADGYAVKRDVEVKGSTNIAVKFTTSVLRSEPV